MVGLAAVALLLLVRTFISSSGPANTVAASVPNAAVAPTEAANAAGRSRGKGAPPLDPTLRTDLLQNSEESEYKGKGRNIFEAQAAIPEPTTTVIAKNTPPPPPQPPPGPPPPPPIPLKFYGFASKPGQPKSVFLANGDDIFIGREGDIVNRRYKILHIMPTQVEIEDVQSNHHEAIPLTQGQG